MSQAIVPFVLSSPQLNAAAHSLPERDIKIAGKSYSIVQPVGDSNTRDTSSSEVKSAHRSFAEFVWNGSILLAHHIATVEPCLVRDKVVVEIGAGLGLLCAVACRFGSSQYVCTDGDPLAVDKTVENLLRNGARRVSYTSSPLLQRASQLLKESVSGAIPSESDSTDPRQTLAWLRDGSEGGAKSGAERAGQSSAPSTCSGSSARPTSECPWTHLQLHGTDVIVTRLRWGHHADEIAVRCCLYARVDLGVEAALAAKEGEDEEKGRPGPRSGPLSMPSGTAAASSSSPARKTSGESKRSVDTTSRNTTGTLAPGSCTGTPVSRDHAKGAAQLKEAVHAPVAAPEALSRTTIGLRVSPAESGSGTAPAEDSALSKPASRPSVGPSTLRYTAANHRSSPLCDVVLGADVVAVPYARHFAGLAGTLQRITRWSVQERGSEISTVDTRIPLAKADRVAEFSMESPVASADSNRGHGRPSASMAAADSDRGHGRPSASMAAADSDRGHGRPSASMAAADSDRGHGRPSASMAAADDPKYEPSMPRAGDKHSLAGSQFVLAYRPRHADERQFFRLLASGIRIGDEARCRSGERTSSSEAFEPPPARSGSGLPSPCGGSPLLGLMLSSRVPRSELHPDFRDTDGSSVAPDAMLRAACPAAFRLCMQDSTSALEAKCPIQLLGYRTK